MFSKLSICVQRGGVGLSRSCPSPILAKPSQPLCGGGGGRTWPQIIDCLVSQRPGKKTHIFSSIPKYVTHAYYKIIIIIYPQQDEDYDYDDEGEPLLREGEGLAEEVELTLATDAHIDKLYD